MSRIVCQFSCGDASAAATKLALVDYGKTHDVQIINAFIVEEHHDNRRFLADCEVWYDRPIIVLRDQKYGASIKEVFRRKRYMKGMAGAPCSKALKRDVLDAWRLPTDTMVLGYTVEERDRFDRFIDAHAEWKVIAPLIDRGLTKEDCHAIVRRAGIARSAMYDLGYHNANCIGCIKGGEGYWNKIKRDFPEQAEELMTIQDAIGPGAFLFRNRKTGERYSIRNLPPENGRYKDEPSIECGVFCEMAEQDIRLAETVS